MAFKSLDQTFFFKALWEIQQINEEDLDALPQKTLINLLKISMLGVKYFTGEVTNYNSEKDVSEFVYRVDEYAKLNNIRKSNQTENSMSQDNFEMTFQINPEDNLKNELEEIREKYHYLKEENDKILQEFRLFSMATEPIRKFKSHKDISFEKEVKYREKVCEELENHFKRLFESEEISDLENNDWFTADEEIQEGNILILSSDESFGNIPMLDNMIKRRKIKQSIDSKYIKNYKSLVETELCLIGGNFQEGKLFCDLKLRKNDIIERHRFQTKIKKRKKRVSSITNSKNPQIIVSF